MAEGSEFGTFFRETRQALGLTLREFCRRNGFDQANVSRMERGLVPAPKGEKTLRAYAKALKLKPEGAEWERFMSLAISERVPQSLLVKPKRGHGHRNWVRAKHLEDWAGTKEAQNTLPQLVRRLIRATHEGTVRLEAPSGEQTQRPGWDGLVEATADSEYVPGGVSAWEMGTDREPKAKADSDWTKRQKKAAGVTNRDATFVFVTPRKWQKKSDWVEEKSRLKTWKAVRVYDSASLEEWLECAPAVDIWLAKQLGLCPPGFIDVDDWWKNLEALTEPSLKAEVYLASREKQLAELVRWVNSSSDTLLLESRSPAEALDFIVAASRQPELGEAFAARAIVVDSRDAWRTLAGGDARLILIVHPQLSIEAELVVEAVRNGQHVILCAPTASGVKHNRIELPRVSEIDLQKALEAQGVPHVDAARLTTGAGGSITVLKRLLARYPGTVQPEWSRAADAPAVVPLLLAGGWCDAPEGDRTAVEKLSNLSYSEIVTLAERWSSSPDPLLARGPGRWELVSRDDSWGLLAESLTEEHLRRFENVALAVLGEVDPASELASSRRWQASLFGKERAHSGVLRRGLAESLALLAARAPVKKHLATDPKSLSARVVGTLLEGKDWKAWASLSSELPLLAEAAPVMFLKALEGDLERKPSAVLKLFEEEGEGNVFFGTKHHLGILWALEGLAWDRALLPTVARVLARLREATPSDKRGNSAKRSLEQIFMPWFPQTMAPVEERVKNLEAIAKRYPDTGWQLLLELLPKPHSGVSHNRRPAFQDWALRWTPGTTRKDHAFQVEACSNLLVELAGSKVTRLKEVIDVFEYLPKSSRESLLERLRNAAKSELEADEKRTLSEALREKVNRHRRFAHTEWAMRGEELDELDRVREKLEPQDVVAKNAWLFGDYWKVREQVSEYGKDEDPDKSLIQLRGAALNAVRTERKWEGVLALAEAATSPDQVGWTLGASPESGDDTRVLPALLRDPKEKLVAFGKAYALARQSGEGSEWVKKQPHGRWSDEELLEFALALQPEKKVWDLVRERGKPIEKRYWERLERYSFSKDTEDVSQAATMLAQAGRTFAAVRQLGMARHRDVELHPATTAGVLEAVLKSSAESDEGADLSGARYDIQMLIRELQELVKKGDLRIELKRVAGLEWGYLELLDGHPAVPETLHEWLRTRPEFFVEVLGVIFRRSDEPEAERSEPSETERSRAVQAYRLLNSWQRLPGTQTDGTVDEEELLTWVRSAQALSDKEACREMCDVRIGNVLAFAPGEESDGTWPAIPVRDVIEEVGTEAMMEGFVVGILNNRGAHWRPPEGGGGPEHELAKRYFAWASEATIEWPRTAAALRQVGESYDAEGRRWDTEVR